MNEKYLGLMELSRLLNIPYWRLLYAEQAGHIPEPLRIANKRAYTDEDVELIRAHFQQEETDGSHHALRSAPRV
jgi:DNA-binding transcriptional MerR regulator